MKNKKGFTLIELLVVIGIIGVLATISVASLQSAQQRARDTKRIAGVKSLATVLEGEDAGSPGTILTGCTAGKAISTCTGPSTVADTSFKGLLDPSKTSAIGTVCKTGLTAPCDYSIANKAGTGTAVTNDYQICFYLEAGGAGLQRGMNSIVTGATFTAGCNLP